MKSIYWGTGAANFKMKGKLFHRLACRCCSLVNNKKIKYKEYKESQIKDYMENRDE